MPESHTSPESRILLDEVESPPELRVDILDVRVCQYLEGGDVFEITINALNSENQTLKWIDDQRFSPGTKVEIQLGYLGELKTLIAGEITALRMTYPSNDAALLKIQGFDKLHRLRRGRKTRAHYEIKDSAIAELVAGELGLTPEVQDSQVVHEYLLQNNISDIDFLLERARRIRFELLVDGQKLLFRRAANADGPAVTLEYMKDLKSFSARMTTAQQVGEISVRGWNPDRKEPILGVAVTGDESTMMGGETSGPGISDAAFGGSARPIVDTPVYSQAEADQIAKARFNDMAMEFTSGEGEAVGNLGVRAGRTVELVGLGARLSGDYYVRKAEHHLCPETGYTTNFDVLRNAS